MSLPKFPPNPTQGTEYVDNKLTYLNGKSRLVQSVWRHDGRGWKLIKTLKPGETWPPKKPVRRY